MVSLIKTPNSISAGKAHVRINQDMRRNSLDALWLTLGIQTAKAKARGK